MKSNKDLINNNRQSTLFKGFNTKHTLLTQIVTTIALMFAITAHAEFEERITYYHTDMLGSPVATTDEAGEILWQERYQPYGEKDLNEPAPENKIGYTGHRDEDYGLVYMQARYYDPEIGRFMAIDPVGFMETNFQSFNRYAYANNNPNANVDPDGKRSRSVFKPLTEALKTVKNAADERRLVRNYRNRGVARAWTDEIKLVQETGKGTRNWTKKELQYLKQGKKVPGYKGHHINNVDDFKDLSDNPNNVEFVTDVEHLARHKGNWRNGTTGDLLDRTISLGMSVGISLLNVLSIMDPATYAEMGANQEEYNNLVPTEI